MLEPSMKTKYGEIKPEKDETLHGLAIRHYKSSEDNFSDNREQAKDDIRFGKLGHQWDEVTKNDRQNDGRPNLVINRLPSFLRQVIGDQRQNRPQIKVRPVDDKADKIVADIYSGLIRNIEYTSNAKVTYDTSFSHSLGNGFGFIHLSTKYSEDDSFNQDIVIRRVFNPLSVYLDPASIEADYSDGNFAFITEWISVAEFKRRYPKKSAVSVDSAGVKNKWFRDKEVQIAKWYRRVPIKKEVALLSTGETIDLEGVKVITLKGEDGQDIEGIVVEDIPVGIIRRKTIDSHKIVHYLISGKEILEGPTEWAGKYIPIIPVLGEEVCDDNGQKRYFSLIHWAKDSNRMYNFMRSAAVEHIALAPKQPFLVTSEQISGHEKKWAEANTKNLPYLEYNADPFAQAPIRSQPPQVSTAIITEANASIEDIKSTMGMHDASMGRRGPEQSAKAIMALQREGDTSVYTWVDNLHMAIGHLGRAIVDLIPKIYDTERLVRIRGIDGDEEVVAINTVAEGEDGLPIKVNDLSFGKYDVVIEAGPSFSTQRLEAADAMFKLLQVNPQSAQLVMDELVEYLHFPGASKLARRFHKMLPPELQEDDDGNPIPLEPPPPTPKEEIEGKKLELENQKLNVEAAKTSIEAEKVQDEGNQSLPDIAQAVRVAVRQEMPAIIKGIAEALD